MTSNARPLRYVIIGAAGAVAEKHARALARLPADLAGMCDVDERRGGERARAAGCPFARDAATMLREVRPDVALICTPPASHVSLARECLLLGIHVLVEKPMAVEVAEADELIALADQSRAVVAVSFGERFRSSVEHARNLISGGQVGRLLRVELVQAWRRDPAYYEGSTWRGTWRGEGGGVLMNQAPHPFDLLCHLLGSPSRVWGITRTMKHTIECEDTAHAMLEYPSGAVGHIAVTTAQGTTARRLAIVGERAVLTWDGDRLTIANAVSDGPVACTTEAGSLLRARRRADSGHQSVPDGAQDSAVNEVVLVDRNDSELGLHEAVHRDLRRAVLEGTPPRCSAREARMSLELANAIALSSATGAPVSLPVERSRYSDFLRQRRGA